MRVLFDQTEAGIVCYVTGNLEHLSVGQFRESAARIRGNRRVIFELSAVPFVDSAGLGALIGAVRRIRETGGDVVVCSARPSVRRVLDMVGLSRIVDVLGTVADAEAYFSRSAIA